MKQTMSTKQSECPSILFVLTDDQRFDAIRACGNESIATPNIDRLAREGVTFTNAYIMGGTSAAVCMPSRAMLLTGRTLFHLEGEGESIPEEHVTLGEALQNQGYFAFGTGKWHNGVASYARSFSDGGPFFPSGMADHWNVPVCEFHPDGQYPENRPHHRYDGKVVTVAPQCYDYIIPEKHSTELFCDAAVDFLDRYQGPQPFFLYLSLMALHDPRTAPQEYLDMYASNEVPLPPNFLP